MRKIMIFSLLFFAFFILSIFSFEQNYSWQKIKPLCLKALEENKKIKEAKYYFYFIKKAKTFNEEEEIIRLCVLTTDKPYEKFVLNGIRAYDLFFDSKIKKTEDGQERKNLLIRKINGLIIIYEALDEQIRNAYYQNNLTDVERWPYFSSFQTMMKKRIPEYFHLYELNKLRDALDETEKMKSVDLKDFQLINTIIWSQ